MSRPNPQEPSNLQLFLFFLILVIILGFGVYLALEPEDQPQSETEPVGKIVNVVEYDTWIAAQTALITRLVGQPSQEAKLNALAQEGCEVTDELQRQYCKDYTS